MDNYFNYLHLRSRFDQINAKYKLDIKDEMMLDHVARITKDGEPLWVNELMSTSSLGSQATNHLRMSKLIQKGFLDQKAQKDDRRLKAVVLGKKGKTRAQEVCDLVGDF